MPHRISVLLVDDHPVLRRELRRALDDDPEIAVLGEAGNGVEALKLAQQLTPEVVVMDVTMPLMDGMEATREILKCRPQTAVLMLSINEEERCIRDAFNAGARGYLLKGVAELDLAGAIKDVALGKRVLRCGVAQIES